MRPLALARFVVSAPYGLLHQEAGGVGSGVPTAGVTNGVAAGVGKNVRVKLKSLVRSLPNGNTSREIGW